MDRETMNQIDRIEQKLDILTEGQELLVNMDNIEILKGFYEEEILGNEGQLTHLKDDKKLVDFFEKILKDVDDEEEQVDEEEYKSKPFE